VSHLSIEKYRLEKVSYINPCPLNVLLLLSFQILFFVVRVGVMYVKYIIRRISCPSPSPLTPEIGGCEVGSSEHPTLSEDNHKNVGELKIQQWHKCVAYQSLRQGSLLIVRLSLLTRAQGYLVDHGVASTSL